MMMFQRIAFLLVTACFFAPLTEAQDNESDQATIKSTIAEDGTGRIVIEARGQLPKAVSIYTAKSDAVAKVSRDRIEQTLQLEIKVLQGDAETVSLGLVGAGQVESVKSEAVQSWAVRQEGDKRFLDIRLQEKTKEAKATVTIRSAEFKLPAAINLTHLAPGKSIGFDSTVHVQYDATVEGKVVETKGFLPLDSKGTSNRMRTSTGGLIKLALSRSGAAPNAVEIQTATLKGKLDPDGDSIQFQLQAKVKVNEPDSTITILSGSAAVADLPSTEDAGYRLQLATKDKSSWYQLVFDKPGEYPIELDFVAKLSRAEGDARGVDFSVAASAIVPLEIEGLADDLQFHRATDFILPVQVKNKWVGFLPATGRTRLQWKPTRKAGEGKLFFTTTAQIDATIGAGLLRQSHAIDYKVLQGSVPSLTMTLRGPGEILDVQGANIVAWKVSDAGQDRQLDITLSQPLTGEGKINIRSQTALDPFPVRIEGLRVEPQGVIRHSGFLRLSNSGSVRLEPVDLVGLTQLSPGQFPGGETKARQVFVYRFPAADHSFSIAADRIQPEVNVSQLVLYQLAETDRAIKADIELDIREAPIREWDFLVPEDYSVVSVSGASVADYIAATQATDGQRNLKVIFAADISGRQLVSLHLEKNEAAAAGNWTLPKITYPNAKTVRGDIGIVGAAGFRVAAGDTNLLVDKPLSYFPKPTANLQQAFRIRETDWSATMKIEALQRNVQSDVFHLYSLSQGAVYGSALINYFVTGAPVSEWKIAVPASLGNIMVDGKDVRTWRREDDTLIVSLHQGVIGPFVLLVTYEAEPEEGGSFEAGQVRPLNVQSERGYIQIVSPMQVDVEASNVSEEMLVLDPLELPAEFRLLTTAPSLGTWQYTERPIQLDLNVNWFQPGTTVSQVVEFSEANSRVSSDGELVTDVIYYLKSRGQRSFKVKLPGAPVRLWEAVVNGRPVTARQTEDATLLPLPGGTDPNVPIEVKLRLGKPAVSESYPELALPTVFAPVLKTQWNVSGDEKHTLIPTGGNVTPPQPVTRPSGFTWLVRRGTPYLFFVGLFAVIGVVARWGSSNAARAVSLIALLVAIGISVNAAFIASRQLGYGAPLKLDMPILTAGTAIELDVRNTPNWQVDLSWFGVFAIVLGIAAIISLHMAYAESYRQYGWLVRTAGVMLIGLGVLAQGGGGPWFFGLLAAAVFLLLFIRPAWEAYKDGGEQFRQWRDQRRERKALEAEQAETESDPDPGPGTTGPATAMIGFLIFAFTFAGSIQAAPPAGFHASDSIQQQWQITSEDHRLSVKGTVRITGQPGDQFVLLKNPAVLTRFDGKGLRLNKVSVPKQGLMYVVTIPLEQTDDEDLEPEQTPAKEYQAEFEYQLDAVNTGGIPVLTGTAAVALVDLEYDQAGWEVASDAAVRIESVKSDATKFKILLAPRDATIVLKPKARDVAAEETRFFVEGANLFLPSPGVVDGRHRLNIRTSQGRVRELIINVPKGLTVGSADGPIGSWQFDAESGELKLTIEPPQSKPFNLMIETQRGLDPLPAAVTLAPLTVADAGGEVGLLAVAFGSDAQPENLNADTMSPVNLGDFDPAMVPKGVVVHRVYRYGSDAGELTVRVAPVEPEVRVVSKQVLSLGDERVLLNVNFSAEIARAGLFQLSFPLPDGFEVESLSGQGLHHWAELTEDDQRKIILHLNGKTLGKQLFSLSLTSAAPEDVDQWQVPRFELNEAKRQTGDLIVRPTTGIRLRTVSRQNVSEADPRELGGGGQGALAFRLLQSDWNLQLGVEKLDPWVTGHVLHEVTLREGQTRSTLMGQFNVQNASIQSLQVSLPISDEDEIKTLRASGKQVSDFIRSDSNSDVWDVQFKRRVVGRIQFQIEYERRGDRKDDTETLMPASFPQARQLTYHFGVRAGGRLDIEAQPMTDGWQAAEWNTVPQAVRESGSRAAPALTLRAISPESGLKITAKRHSLADALKLRVAKGALTTVLSQGGHQLTSVELDMEVIQRSSLSVRLPSGGELFSIFVNGESVHSIRKDDGGANQWQFYILPGIDDRTAKVRFVYSLPGRRISSLDLTSPEMNVPLENIQWKVIAPKGYELTDNDGSLELIQLTSQGAYDRNSYLSKVRGKRQAQAQAATQLLEEANKLLQAGEQTKARWAFNSVANQYALDAASNEDARVQLENLQTQQAIVGLNTRRQRLFLDNNDSDISITDNQQMEQAAAANPVLQQDDLNYRPQQLSQLLQGNTSEDNKVLQQIAVRLVQHQRAAEPAPQAIIISLPEEGKTYTFGRAVQVAENAPLELDLSFKWLLRLDGWNTFFVLALMGLLAWMFSVAGLRRA